jgi:predicted phage baseplate assembly protein
VFVVPATSSKAAVYFTSSAVAAPNSGESVAISVNEGREVKETLTSNFSGESAAAFLLSEQKVIPASLSITVGTTTYSHTLRMFDSGADSPTFTSLVDSDDFTRVVLGNGVNGRVPPAGSTVEVTYRVGQGSLGNVAVNTITTMDSPVLHIAVVSSTVASGGSDAESVASIKKNAPSLRRVQDRAVTLTDYTTLMKGFAGVTKAVAVSSVSSGLVTVKYAALPTFADYHNMAIGTSTLHLTPAAGTPNFGTPGEEIFNNMEAYLQDRSMIGVTVSPISTTINLTNVYVAFNSVQVKDGYYQEAVKSAIDTAVRNLFTWDALDFNMTIRLSAVLSAAQAVSGVQSVFISNLGSSSGGSSVADFTPTATTTSAVSLPVLRTITFTGVSGGIS